MKTSDSARTCNQAVLAFRFCLLASKNQALLPLVMPVIFQTGDVKGNDQLESVLS